MSAQTPPTSALPGAADPSMEDILASIRRILSEDEATAASPGEEPAAPPEEDGVLMLDDSMMVATPIEPVLAAEPPALPHAPLPHLLAPETEAAAAASVGALLRTLSVDRATEVHRGGPTIEDLVREGIRPMLKSWLDVHLPPLVERAVRAEIERITGRAGL